MALSTLLVWAAGLGALAYALLHRRRYLLAARIPGPKLWLPLIGNLIDTILHYGFGNIDWLWGYYKRFGNVYCMYIGPNLTFITSDPADVEAITTNPNLIDKGSEYSLLIPWLGEGLLLRGGNTWHSRRKLLTPTFHFRILDQFLDVFNEKAVVLESKLQTLVGQDPVDMRSYLSRFTLDVICETAMGTPTNAQTNEDSEFVKAVKTACRTTIYRYRLPWLRNDAIFRMSQAGKDFYSALEVMHSTVREVIKTRKEGVQMELREGSKEANLNTEDDIDSIFPNYLFAHRLKKRIVFIDQLLTMHLQGEDLSEKDIFDEVNTFMFAGHDTTMTSMSFTLFLLAKHPAVQQRVVEEVIEVTEGSGNITSATLSQLKYLEAVIKESLRLYPSAPVFFRECTSELSLPSGYTVPAGSSIMVNLMVMHYDEKNFREPLKFDPDRFLSGTEEKRHHFAYIPFSAGYRNCIGQKFAMLSMKTVLARILRSFRFVLPSENSEIHLDMEVVLTAKSIPLVIQRR